MTNSHSINLRFLLMLKTITFESHNSEST